MRITGISSVGKVAAIHLTLAVTLLLFAMMIPENFTVIRDAFTFLLLGLTLPFSIFPIIVGVVDESLPDRDLAPATIIVLCVSIPLSSYFWAAALVYVWRLLNLDHSPKPSS